MGMYQCWRTKFRVTFVFFGIVSPNEDFFFFCFDFFWCGGVYVCT